MKSTTSFRFQIVAVAFLAVQYGLGYSAAATQIDLAVPVEERGVVSVEILGTAETSHDIAKTQARLTLGDFNGDGYDDLLTLQDIHAYIVYGAPGQANETLDLSGEGTGVTTITSTSNLLAAAAGDLNEDGIDDAILRDANALYIVYGDTEKPGSATSAGTELILTAEFGTVIPGVSRLLFQTSSKAVHWLECADFNADGLLDIVVADGDSSSLDVFYGVPGPWGKPVGAGYDLYQKSWGSFYPNSALITYLPGLLSAITVGDYDGDGYDDLAIGISNANVQTRIDAGIVAVLYGQPEHWARAEFYPDRVLLGSAANDVVSTQGELRILGDNAFDLLGTALASADLNADGFSDLAIGAPGAYVNGTPNAGEVYILYGAAQRPGVVSGAGHLLDLDSAGEPSAAGESRILGGTGNTGFGTVLAACDWNGDGLDDLAIASPGGGSPERPGAGMVEILYGSTTPPGVPFETGSILNLYNESTDVQILGAEADAALGNGLVGGFDFNRDGLPDLVAGAALDADAASPNFASLSILFGAPHSATATATASFNDGTTPSKGLGGGHSPALRAHVSFDGGQGNLATVQLLRDGHAAIVLPSGEALPPLWQFSTTRTGWQSATLTVQYTSADLGSTAEDSLAVWTAPSPEGPWTLPVQSQHEGPNTITLALAAPGYVVLAGGNLSATVSRVPQQEAQTGELPMVFQIDFDAPVTGLGPDDFFFTGTAPVEAAEIIGSDAHYELRITAMNQDGTVQPMLRSGAVQDSEGRPNAQSRSLDDGVLYGGVPPVITLLGDRVVTLDCPEKFIETGYTASDGLDGDLTEAVQWSDEFDYMRLRRTYTVVDSFGKTGSITRILNAVSYVSPIMTLNGEATMYLACNEPFTDPGATALDPCTRQPIAASIPRAPNISAPKEFTLLYFATDQYHRTRNIQRQLIITPKEAPTLLLLGDSVVDLLCDTPFNDPGAVAMDGCSNSLSKFIQRTGTIDRKTPGTYTLTYSVEAAGGPLSTTRTVNVVLPCPSPFHTADQDQNDRIELFELLRVAQFYNLKGYHCATTPTEDGYQPGPGEDHNCAPHDADYKTQDWQIGLSEILRIIQYFQLGSYQRCDAGEDGFCLDSAGLIGTLP